MGKFSAEIPKSSITAKEEECYNFVTFLRKKRFVF